MRVPAASRCVYHCTGYQVISLDGHRNKHACIYSVGLRETHSCETSSASVFSDMRTHRVRARPSVYHMEGGQTKGVQQMNQSDPQQLPLHLSLRQASSSERCPCSGSLKKKRACTADFRRTSLNAVRLPLGLKGRRTRYAREHFGRLPSVNRDSVLTVRRGRTGGATRMNHSLNRCEECVTAPPARIAAATRAASASCSLVAPASRASLVCSSMQ